MSDRARLIVPLLLVVVSALLAYPLGMLMESAPAVHAQGFGAGPRWECSLDAVSAITRCASAPNDGTTIYITDVLASNTTAVVSVLGIQAGTGTACGTGSVSVLFPATAASTNRFILPPIDSSLGGIAMAVQLNLRTPLRVPTGRDVCVTAGQAAAVHLLGYLAP